LISVVWNVIYLSSSMWFELLMLLLNMEAGNVMMKQCYNVTGQGQNYYLFKWTNEECKR